VAVFSEPEGHALINPIWANWVGKRVEVLGALRHDPNTLLTLYERPAVGGNMGEPADKVKRFYKTLGINLLSTARAISVIEEIIAGRGLRCH